MLTSSQAEVIRFLHSKFYDAEPVGDEKVQIMILVDTLNRARNGTGFIAAPP
jgi:hypothetical protein